MTNQMKICGDTMTGQTIIEKVLRSLTSQFDFIVVAFEQTKNISVLKIEELQGNLKAHELCVTERRIEKEKAIVNKPYLYNTTRRIVEVHVRKGN